MAGIVTAFTLFSLAAILDGLRASRIFIRNLKSVEPAGLFCRSL